MKTSAVSIYFVHISYTCSSKKAESHQSCWIIADCYYTCKVTESNITKIYKDLIFAAFEKISKHLKYILYKTTQKKPPYLEFTCRSYKKSTNVFNIPTLGKFYAFS